MNEGDAKSWKGQFIQNTQGLTGLDLKTWTQFIKELTNAFQPYDAPGDALEHLTNMKMGSKTTLLDSKHSWKNQEYQKILHQQLTIIKKP